jgi:hypothetical protein
MSERSIRNENLRLKREVAELRRKAAEQEKYKIKADPAAPVSPDHTGGEHSDLTEFNTSALLFKKQTSPAEVAEKKAAQGDPVYAAYLKNKKLKRSRWIDL